MPRLNHPVDAPLLCSISIITAKMTPSASCSLRVRRHPRKLRLNDLKLGFDRGEIGARLICLPRRRCVVAGAGPYLDYARRARYSTVPVTG
jgi:hypothetical protein